MGEENKKMQEKFNSLRSGVPKETRDEVEDFFHLDTPASMTLPYPGLDGHPRRITPIPISLSVLPSVTTASVCEGWFKTPELTEKERLIGERANAEEEVESFIQKGSQISGTNRSTIGDTTIDTAEAAMIRREVRSAIQQAFPGIAFSTGQPIAEVIDLSGSAAHSAPLAIAGSDVSVASTRSNNGAGESKTSFSQLVSGAGTVAPA